MTVYKDSEAHASARFIVWDFMVNVYVYFPHVLKYFITKGLFIAYVSF